MILRALRIGFGNSLVGDNLKSLVLGNRHPRFFSGPRHFQFRVLLACGTQFVQDDGTARKVGDDYSTVQYMDLASYCGLHVWV